MANNLWKVTVIQTSTSLVKGMEVEIIRPTSHPKPTLELISGAFNEKYGIKTHPSQVGGSNVVIKKMV